MEREYTTVRLTAEDLNGFRFQKVEEDERESRIRSIKRVRNKNLIMELVVFLIGFVIGVYCLEVGSTAWGMIGSLVAVCMICAMGMTGYTWHYNSRLFRSSAWQQIEVELCEKLPEEKEYLYKAEGANSVHYFYPVTGRDIHTGYQSKIYVGKEDYDNFKKGSVILVKITL